MTAAAVTKSQAYAIDPGSLTAQITEWTSAGDAIEQHLTQASRDYTASTSYWIGAAGDRARTSATDTRTASRAVTDALTNAVTAATAGQTKIATAKQVTIAAIELTEKNKFKVAEDGTVTAPDAKLSLPSNATADDVTKAQAALDYKAKHIYEPPIKQALAGLGQILEDTASNIDKAFADIGGIRSLPTTLPVALGERSQQVQDIIDGKAVLPTDPKTFHDYWATLSQEDRDALWQHDQYLGNHDGMPAADRDHYNRLKLDDEMTRAAAAHNEIADLTKQHPDWAKYTGTSKEADSWLASHPGYSDWKAKWDTAQQRAKTDGMGKSYDDLKKIYDIVHDPNHPGRMLLQLDSQTGERVHTIIADGNPDTASNITTYVPGTGSKPSKMGPDMDRVDAMTDQALNAGARRPVTVAWFGYDAPPGLPDATERKYADAAAPALDGFQQGLRATHEGVPSRNIVLGHSYGTTVVGDAAAHGRTLDADAVVMVASPGTTVDHAADLNLTGVPYGQQPQHVFATKAENDPVPLYPMVSGLPGMDDYGPDPTDDNFGAQVFTSDPGTRGLLIPALTHSLAFVPTELLGLGADYSTEAHSDYWDHNSKSLTNMGYIIAGDLTKVEYQ